MNFFTMRLNVSSSGRSCHRPANPRPVRVEPLAGDVVEDVVDLLPLVKPIQETP